MSHAFQGRRTRKGEKIRDGIEEVEEYEQTERLVQTSLQIAKQNLDAFIKKVEEYVLDTDAEHSYPNERILLRSVPEEVLENPVFWEQHFARNKQLETIPLNNLFLSLPTDAQNIAEIQKIFVSQKMFSIESLSPEKQELFHRGVLVDAWKIE